MTYLVLARKYRPQTFDGLIAQQHITETLKNAIKTDHVAQAFLFTGPRGVGKTSMARILAKALNCEKGPTIHPCNECKNCKEITNSTSVDVVEIDGASNTSVDDVRRLQNELIYPPQNSSNKIYIIDEVHMLSKNAFNALLKTLEEPPEKVKFIFATTEPHKVLPTITSRCQRYDFHRIPIPEITKHIKNIIAKEDIEFDDQAIFLVAKKADGSLRDALSLMDQIVSIGKTKITKEDVLQVFGIVDINVFHSLTQNIINKNNKEIVDNFHALISEGNDINEIIMGFIEYLRNILMLKIGIIPEEVHDDDIQEIKEFTEDFSEEDLLYAITILMDSKEKLKTFSHPVLLFETTLLKLTNLSQLKQIDKIQSEIENSSASTLNIQDKKPVYTNSKKKIQNKESRNVNISNDNSLNLETIKDSWADLVSYTKDEYPIIASKLEKLIPENFQNNVLNCTTPSNHVLKQINQSGRKVTKILRDYFNKKIRIRLERKDHADKEFYHSPTYDDICNQSPKLARIINKIDGYIVDQKRE